MTTERKATGGPVPPLPANDRRQTMLWVLAALAGIALAAGITYATSRLASQHIGLASESPAVALGLAPTTTTPSATTPSATTPTSTTPVQSPAPRRTVVTPTLTVTRTVTAPPAPTVTAPPTKTPRASGGGSGEAGRRRGDD